MSGGFARGQLAGRDMSHGAVRMTIEKRDTLQLHKRPGLHLMGDLYQCACEVELMVNGRRLRARCLEFVKQVSLPLGITFTPSRAAVVSPVR